MVTYKTNSSMYAVEIEGQNLNGVDIINAISLVKTALKEGRNITIHRQQEPSLLSPCCFSTDSPALFQYFLSKIL